MEEPGRYENEWRSAFEGAETTPAPEVWQKVELKLANTANTSYKRRLLFHKFLTAASVAFALTVGGIAIYLQYDPAGDNSVAQESAENEELLSFNDPAVNNHQDLSNSDVSREAADGKDVEDKDVNEETDEKNLVSIENEGIQSNHQSVSQEYTADNRPDSKREVGSSADRFANLNKNEVPESGQREEVNSDSPAFMNTTAKPSTSDEGAAASRYAGKTSDQIPEKLEKRMAELQAYSFDEPELAMVPWYAYAPASNRKHHTKKVWAGVGLASGSYDPSGSAVSGSSQTSAAGLDENSSALRSFLPEIGEEQDGRSLNIGLNVGAQVAPKWIVQSGLVFIDRSTSNTSNVVQFDGDGFRAVNSYSELSSQEDLGVTNSTFEINNSYRFISVPVQAGYILLDRKFNITLLGGISNDLFLRKSVEGEAAGLEEYNVENGIRRYNLTGLLSTELGYRLGQNYMLSLTPQIRQSVNTVNTSGDDNRPTFFELGFRFKYMLK